MPYQVPLDRTLSVRKVVRHLAKGNRYMIRITGDSMEPRFHHDDLILVDTTVEPRSGKTVLAMLNGKTTVKNFHRGKDGIALRPLNTPKYKDIRVGDDDELKIIGIVITIVERSV